MLYLAQGGDIFSHLNLLNNGCLFNIYSTFLKFFILEPNCKAVCIAACKFCSKYKVICPPLILEECGCKRRKLIHNFVDLQTATMPRDGSSNYQ